MSLRLAALSALAALALSVLAVQADEPKTQRVVVVGVGDTPQSAAVNAAENALTQVVGSFVDTETILRKKVEIQNGVKDQTKQIDTSTREFSQGSIKRFEVVSTEKDGALVKVTADVEVRIEDFRAYIKKLAEDSAEVETGVFASIATSKKQSENAAGMVLDGVTSILTGEVIQFQIGEIAPFSDWKAGNANLNLAHPTSQNTFVLPLKIEINGAFLENFKAKLDNVSFQKKTIEAPNETTFPAPCYTARRETPGFDESIDAVIATDNGNSTWSLFMIKNGRAGSKALDYRFSLNPEMSLAESVHETALASPQMLLNYAMYLYPDLVVEFQDAGGRSVKTAIVSRNNRYSTSDQTVFASGGWSSIGGDDLSQSSTASSCLVIYPQTSIDLFATLTDAELATVKSIRVAMATAK